MENDANRRILRVEKELRELMSSYMVMQMASEIEGIASITRVIVSKDLRNAKALVYNQDGEAVAEKNVIILQARAPHIQQYINSQIRMRYIPKIKFIVDNKFEDAMKVEAELHKLELERQNSEQTDDNNNDDNE